MTQWLWHETDEIYVDGYSFQLIKNLHIPKSSLLRKVLGVNLLTGISSESEITTVQAE